MSNGADGADRTGIADLLGLAGVEEDVLSLAEEHVLAAVERLAGLGVSAEDLSEVGQAYIRGVGRVTAAEAEIISVAASNYDADDALDYRTKLISAALELGRETFGVLHGSMLARALRRTHVDGRYEAPTRSAAVAHVDVMGSTAMLEHATAADTQRLVDGLFTAGQSAIHGRAVEATKYAGDGVFFVGPQPADVARASLDCLQTLSEGFGLTARAGLSFGPVVHRAGDVFGLPVNLSHILTKSAGPGMLLATSRAAQLIPAEMQAGHQWLEVTALSRALEAVEIVRESPGAEGQR